MKSNLNNPLHLIHCDIHLFGYDKQPLSVLADQTIAVRCKATYGVDLMSQLTDKIPGVSTFKVENAIELAEIKTKAEYLSRLGEIDFIATLTSEQVMENLHIGAFKGF